MSRFSRCDGPNCTKERPRWPYEAGYYDFITVEANEDADHGDFCSWTCLAAWATEKALDREGRFAATSLGEGGSDD